jgi:hypothetical protein
MFVQESGFLVKSAGSTGNTKPRVVGDSNWRLAESKSEVVTTKANLPRESARATSRGVSFFTSDTVAFGTGMQSRRTASPVEPL